MKKIFPILLLVGFVLALSIGGFWFVNKGANSTTNMEVEDEDEVLQELALEDKPYVSLTPGNSCLYTIAIANIKKSPAKVEYELIYKNSDDVLQGASGTVTPLGEKIEPKEVLFGTESSGHRRCDEGVEEGDITIRYRDDEGRLMAKLVGKFGVAEGVKTLVFGEEFSVELDKLSKDKFVIMDTFGFPEMVEGKVVTGPIGIFKSGKATALTGVVNLKGEGKLRLYNGTKWLALEGVKTPTVGTFVKIN